MPGTPPGAPLPLLGTCYRSPTQSDSVARRRASKWARKRSGSKARALALTKSQRRDRAHVQASVGGDVLTVSHQVNPQLDHATPTIFTRWGSHTQSSSSPDAFTHPCSVVPSLMPCILQGIRDVADRLHLPRPHAQQKDNTGSRLQPRCVGLSLFQLSAAVYTRAQHAAT